MSRRERRISHRFCRVDHQQKWYLNSYRHKSCEDQVALNWSLDTNGQLIMVHVPLRLFPLVVFVLLLVHVL